MKPTIPSISALVIAVSTFTANANPMLSTRSLVQEAGLFAQAARHGQTEKRLNIAQSKLERAVERTYVLPNSPLKRELHYQLDDALIVLKNPRIPTERQIQITENRTEQAVETLNTMLRRERVYNSEFIDEAIRLIDVALDADRNDNEFRTQRLLDISIDTLRPFASDGKITASIQNIQEMRSLFRRNLDENSRTMRRIRFLASDAKALAKHSDAYTADRPVEFVVGQTKGLSKRDFETEVVVVPGNLRKGVEELYLLGFNSDARLLEVKIYFTDGSYQILGSRYLAAGVKVAVVLNKDYRGNKKAVARVAVTGRTIESGRHSPQAVVRISTK